MTVTDTAPVGSARRYRALLAYGVLALSGTLMLFYRVKDTLAGGDDYQSADWLINYGGGFVRRGLFGELFLAVTPPGSLWLLFLVQALPYAVVFVFAVWMLRRDDFAWSTIALVCGPAALGFFGWDPGAGFRKEVLSYVVLALLVWAMAPGARRARVALLSAVALVVFALAVFSWETSALFLPAIVFVLLRPRDGIPASALLRRILAGAFVLLGAAGLALGALFHGTEQTAAAVCQAVRDHGYTAARLCTGAIDAIGWTSQYTLASVAESFPLYLGYLPLLVLALIPAVASAWIRQNRIWAVVIAGAFLPLFVIVTDYGRWIDMVVMALLFCIAASGRALSFSRLWTPLAVVLYVALWGLPHWLPADYDGPWPWFGLLQSIIDTVVDVVRQVLA
ncbi:hypothetical protein BH09ACT5_BH09ACT5_17070 [soil metagenome]